MWYAFVPPKFIMKLAYEYISRWRQNPHFEPVSLFLFMMVSVLWHAKYLTKNCQKFKWIWDVCPNNLKNINNLMIYKIKTLFSVLHFWVKQVWVNAPKLSLFGWLPIKKKICFDFRFIKTCWHFSDRALKLEGFSWYWNFKNVRLTVSSTLRGK